MVDNQKYLNLIKSELHKAPLSLLKLQKYYLNLIKEEKDLETRQFLSGYINELVAELNFNLNKITPSSFFNLLVIPLISSCNLNCKGCDAYAPLCDSADNVGIYSAENIGEDLQLLSEKGFRFREVSLEGGEPLLHPSLLSVVRSVRKNCAPITKVTILTNGMLLHKFSDDFFKEIQDLNCVWVIDKYYEDNQLLKNIEHLQKLNISVELDGCVDGTGWFHRAPLNLKTSTEAESSFQHFISCEKANNIVTLDRGFIYCCGRSASIKYFNKHFNLNLPDEGVSVKDSSQKEIMQFLAKPKELCKYCLPLTHSQLSWAESKKEISEWAEI